MFWLFVLKHNITAQNIPTSFSCSISWHNGSRLIFVQAWSNNSICSSPYKHGSTHITQWPESSHLSRRTKSFFSASVGIDLFSWKKKKNNWLGLLKIASHKWSSALSAAGPVWSLFLAPQQSLKVPFFQREAYFFLSLHSRQRTCECSIGTTPNWS